ncbi:MAG: hypothetical protein HXN43_06200 [Prevotella micans]|nr:hypothetical protein [Prevotella micans]
MEKKTYTSPRIEITRMQIESLLETISLPIGGGSAGSGGESKQDIFEDDEETAEVGYGRTSVWDD